MNALPESKRRPQNYRVIQGQATTIADLATELAGARTQVAKQGAAIRKLTDRLRYFWRWQWVEVPVLLVVGALVGRAWL